MQLLWSYAWLLVTHVSFTYLADEFLFLFLVYLNKMKTLSKSYVLSFCVFLFLVLIRWNEEGR